MPAGRFPFPLTALPSVGDVRVIGGAGIVELVSDEVPHAIIDCMLTASAEGHLAALRQPRSAVRIARALWISWAIVVWNVVFDHVIEVAGRQYIVAATSVAGVSGPYARMDDWMRPAVTRALWTASAAGVAVLVVGLILIGPVAGRLHARASRSV